MIEHFMIKNFKAIKELEINNLGIINSFCGKNNSGKTTILEALYGKKYFLGKELNQDSLDEVKYSFNQIYNGLTSEIQRVINLIFQDIKEKVVFGDISYLKELTNNIIEQNNTSVKKNNNVLDSLRNIIYHHIINKQPTYRYVPAKRNIQEYSKIDLNEKFTSNGIGIINKLFYLRSQLPNSEKYNKFMRIYNAFESITNHNFNISPYDEDLKINSIKIEFMNKAKEDIWIDSKDCGQGLSDILIIIANFILMDEDIILIEEPENHLHYDLQRKFLKYVKENITEKQVIFSTHASIFLNLRYIDKVYYVKYEDEIEINDSTPKVEMLNDLGYDSVDNLSYDWLILVEGHSDILVLEKIFEWIELDDYIVKFWTLGGDSMKYIDMSVLDKKNVSVLLDKDPKSQKGRKDFINSCKKYQIKYKILDRYAIENYFTIDAIKKVFKNNPNIPTNITKIDPDIKLENQIKIDVKKNNKKIINKMVKGDLLNTDLLNYCEEIKQLITE